MGSHESRPGRFQVKAAELGLVLRVLLVSLVGGAGGELGRVVDVLRLRCLRALDG
jgi:hypothetical protein